jgi:hypothetical protein
MFVNIAKMLSKHQKPWYTANNLIMLTHSYNCRNMACKSLPADRKSADYEWQCQSGIIGKCRIIDICLVCFGLKDIA